MKEIEVFQADVHRIGALGLPTSQAVDKTSEYSNNLQKVVRILARLNNFLISKLTKKMMPLISVPVKLSPR